jgi:hypothetical protein
MSAFGCADPRDKLYGILHFAYNEDDPDRPIPNYGKDTFAIVTELLWLFRDLPYPTQDLDNAIRLTQLFCVPLDLNRFDQAWKEYQAPRTFKDSP